MRPLPYFTLLIVLVPACVSVPGTRFADSAEVSAADVEHADGGALASDDGGAPQNAPPDTGVDTSLAEPADPGPAEPDDAEVEGGDEEDSGEGSDRDAGPICPLGEGKCLGNEHHYCEPGSDEPKVVTCEPSTACVERTCEDALGCVEEPRDGAACDDGDACTAGDECSAGECLPGATKLACNDENPCTEDSCLPESGCSYEPIDDLPCDDGLPCTRGDRCAAGECVVDENWCDCLTHADCGALEDSDPCNGTLHCHEFLCVVDPATVPDCTHLEPGECERAACVAPGGTCEIVDVGDGTPCDDGDLCTDGDYCMSGTCRGKIGVICDDENPCTEDSCTGDAGCSYKLADGPCSDANVCTIGDRCAGGECNPGPVVDTCDDQNPCTSDYCDPGLGCQHEDLDVACDDEDECTTGDWCVAGTCTATPRECSDGESCDAGVCRTAYPPPPYGVLAGDIMANHGFIDPEDESEVRIAEWFGRGKILLITFNAGWCIVCRRDTSLLNEWMDVYGPDGLEILSILYETNSQAPITSAFSSWWKRAYGVRFPLVRDDTYEGEDGTAEGGVLADYVEPNTQLPEGTFPVTMVVCTADMRIIHADVGFRDEEEIFPLVQRYLYSVDCATE